MIIFSNWMFNLYFLIALGILYFMIAFIHKWITSRHDREAHEYIMQNTVPLLLQDRMKEHLFWQIIHRSMPPDGDIRDQVERLKHLLTNLSNLEVAAFDRRFQYYLDALHRWDIWGAVYLLHGGCSENTFADFKSWLIGQGQKKFEAVLRNPEAIIDFANRGDNWKGLQYCAAIVYHEKTGDILTPNYFVPDDHAQTEPEQNSFYLYTPKNKPSGEKWSEQDLPIMFPKIAKALSDFRK